MSQSKLDSFVEASVGTLLGFTVSYLLWPAVAAARGIELGSGDQFWVTFSFTCISIVRTYLIRRWFNNGYRQLVNWTIKMIHRLIGDQRSNVNKG